MVPNLVEPSLKPYNSPTLPSNSSYSNAQPNRTDESEEIHGENIANSESPTEQHNDFSRFPDHSTFSTFQGSSSEIMPTVVSLFSISKLLFLIRFCLLPSILFYYVNLI